jgi:hypothetical protein
MDPDVVVYDRFVDGLYAEERDLFLRTAFAFPSEAGEGQYRLPYRIDHGRRAADRRPFDEGRSE